MHLDPSGGWRSRLRLHRLGARSGRRGAGRGSRVDRRGGVLGRAADAYPTFQPVEPGVYAAVGHIGARQQHPGTHQLQVQSGCGGAAHVGEAQRDDLSGPGQLTSAEGRGLRRQPFSLISGHINQSRAQCVGHRGDDHQVTEPA